MLLDHYLRADLGDVPRVAADLERMGFDGLYSAEGPHEPFLPLLLAAEHTTRATVFTNIAVGFARSPMDLAQLANDLQRVSRGRFVLGLGSQIRPHIEHRFSMPWEAPVGRMRELVLAVKAIHRSWNERTPLDFRGEVYTHTLTTPFFDPGPNPYGAPPIWVAGLGPRMTRAAAEVGDGLLVHPFHTGELVRDHVAPAVAAGLTVAHRERDTFTISAVPIVCTGATDAEREAATDGVRRLLAFYGSTPAYRVALEPHGWGELQTELNRLTKAGRWDELAGLVDDEVLTTLAVCGPPAEIGALVEARYRGVVDRVGLSMPYRASRDTLAAVVAGFAGAERG
ncbi:MAG TPA: TIGR03617 family F420-dependent LLM class oxidoreductase [Acidimicrobiia bacterium]|nr:TIGR03617 family F420-dependent LLM class oxidoreductase [Acidimicrobiia bacterium]